MLLRKFIAIALAALLGFVSPAVAQDDMKRVQVQFPAGGSGTTIDGTITGWQSVAYELAAQSGQTMDIRLNASTNQTFFTVFGPGQAPGGGGLAGSELPGPMVPDINVFSAVLPSSGTYTVLVYQMRNASRQGLKSNYTLDVSIVGETGKIVQGDFADGLAGGPDFFEVRTSASGTVNLRADASTGAAILTALPDGAPVRNLGCTTNEGRRWCRVATLADPGFEGWMAGEFLVEGSGPGMAVQLPDNMPVAQGSTDALVPGTNFNATGMIDCVEGAEGPMISCDFGVVREGNGNGSVTITFPDGKVRVIFFEGGTPVAYDESQADAGLEMTVERESDTSIVMIGAERFEFPDAVIFGG